MTPEEVKQKALDDLILFGEAVTKTEIVDGKPTIQYVDPISDEFRVAKYNAEHTDSAMEIKYLPVTESAYDGSKLTYHIGFDPFDMASISKGSIAIWDTRKNALYFDRSLNRDTFRLPRKLKKKIKHYCRVHVISKKDLRFNYDVYKYSKYYGCKILKEKIK